MSELYNFYPTSSWHSLGQKYYSLRSVKLVSHVDSLSLPVQSIAPNGGPIVCYHDQDHSHPNDQLVIEIYSGLTFRHLCTISWAHGWIAGIFWNTQEWHLLVITVNGALYSYKNVLNGCDDYERQIIFVNPEREDEVLEIFDVQLLGDWLAGWTFDNQLVWNRINAKGALLMRPPNITTLFPQCWRIITNSDKADSLSLLYALKGKLWLVNLAGVSDGDSKCILDLSATADIIFKMALSAGLGLLAVLCKSGRLLILSTEEWGVLFDLDKSTQEMCNIVDLCWCGSDAVAIIQQSINSMISVRLLAPGTCGHLDSCKIMIFGASERACFWTELDSLRIVDSESSLNLRIYRVSPALEAAWEVGSVHPAAQAITALNFLRNKSFKVEVILHELGLKGRQEARETLESAALDEEDLFWREYLIEAAKLVALYDEIEDYQMPNVQVMDLLRQSDMAITWSQFLHHGFGNTATLLVSGNHHEAALKVSDVCNGHEKYALKSIVLTDWAIKKVEEKDSTAQIESSSSSKVFHEIMEAYRRHKIFNPSLGPIIRAAIRRGRLSLAMKLLNEEQDWNVKIPLLIHLKMDVDAVRAALASCDPNHIFSLINLLIKQRYALPEVIRLMSANPGGIEALESYCCIISEDSLEEHSKVTILKNLYYQEDNHENLAIIIASQALCETESTSRQALLQETIDTWDGGMKFTSLSHQRHLREVLSFGIGKNCMAALSGQLSLMQSISVLKSELGREFPHNSSLLDTIQLLLKNGKYLQALQLKNDSGLPDSIFAKMKVHALIGQKDFEGLAKEFEACSVERTRLALWIAEECQRSGFYRESIEYLSKCGNDQYSINAMDALSTRAYSVDPSLEGFVKFNQV